MQSQVDPSLPLLTCHPALQLKTAVLRVEQAALTGESVAVSKTAAPIEGEDVELQVGWRWRFAQGTARTVRVELQLAMLLHGRRRRLQADPLCTPRPLASRPRSACCLRAPASRPAHALAW